MTRANSRTATPAPCGWSQIAETTARNRHDLAPPAQQLDIGGALRRLGLGREKRAKGDVIGAGLGRLDGKVTAVVTGDADDGRWPEQPPRLGIAGILLAEMDAVAAGGFGEIGAVVHQKGDVVLLRHRHQRIRGAADRIVGGFLQAKLQAGDIAGVERQGKPVGEIRRQFWRGNEIEAAHAAPR